MPMFSMFVASPPSGMPVNAVYRQKQAFGPFGQAAGEISPESGFSDALWLDVAQSAPQEFRTMHSISAGAILVVGVQNGFPSSDPASPLVVALRPSARAISELQHLFSTVNTEIPEQILYHGLNPESLRQSMELYLGALSGLIGEIQLRTVEGTLVSIAEVGSKAFLDGFLEGSNTINLVEELGMGWPLGEVSIQNLDAGQISFGIEVRTGPPLAASPSVAGPATANRLDPVVMYHELVGSNLTDGTPAIAAAEVANSWLEVVDRTRIIVTFRDEWNAPLRSGEFAVVEGTGTGQTVVVPLTDEQNGTIVAADGGSPYTCRIGTPPSRKLTPVPSDQGASDTVSLDASAPAHRVIASVRPQDWFHSTDPPQDAGYVPLPLFTEGNYLTPLVDGYKAFRLLVKDLKELDDPSTPNGVLPENFVILAGWWLDIDFLLVPGDQTSSIRFLLLKGVSSQHKLIVRGLVWGVNNEKTNAALGLSILDTLHPGFTDAYGTFLEPLIAAFHWKLSVVRNRHGTYAQLGGVDINPNRLDGPDHAQAGQEYHDVHCRIQGPAVKDIVTAFRDRYGSEFLHDVVTDSINPTTSTPAGVSATQMVQIARTSLKNLYSWSPAGDRTIWATFKHAIRRATKYIYLEEQYLVFEELRDELLSALSKIDYLVIVVDGKTDDLSIAPLLAKLNPNISEEMAKARAKGDVARARYLFLDPLVKSSNADKVHVFTLRSAAGDYICHSKVAVIDDIFVKIGSANMNRRGMTHDSELDAFILDGRVEHGARKFARDLRIELWAEHLGWHRSSGIAKARLADVDRAVEWITTRRPRTARLFPYNFSIGAGSSFPLGWDLIIDPDGTSL